jgi:hypothetical protein
MVKVDDILERLSEEGYVEPTIQTFRGFFKKYEVYLTSGKLIDNLENAYVVKLTPNHKFISEFHKNGLIECEPTYLNEIRLDDKFYVQEHTIYNHWIYIFGDHNLALLKLMYPDNIVGIVNIKKLVTPKPNDSSILKNLRTNLLKVFAKKDDYWDFLELHHQVK